MKVVKNKKECLTFSNECPQWPMRIRAGMQWTVLCLSFLPLALHAQTPTDSTGIEAKQDTIKQKDLFDVIEKMFNIHPPEPRDTTDKPFSFSVLPLTTDVPGGGRALVTTVTGSFYLGSRKNTNLSEVWFVPYFDFEGRYGLPVRSYIWLDRNKWALRGDMRILKYPEYTYGLGKLKTDDDKLLVDRSYLRVYQQIFRQVSPGLLLGVGYHLDVNSKIKTNSQDPTLTQFSGYNYGTTNGTTSTSSGISFDLLYDTRGSSINASKGSYLNITYRMNPEFMGSDRYWHSLYVDAKKYYRLTKSPERQNLIALWSYYWTTFNSNAPYFDLPSIGWDNFNTSGRGFQQSRFRAKSLFYLEAEYRKDITRDGLLGFTLFSNLNSTEDYKNPLFSKWSLGVGGGLRIKVDKLSGTNISLDYGFSRGYHGFYITLGEYF